MRFTRERPVQMHSSSTITLGERECAERNLDFAETFRRQFLFSPHAAQVPEGWTVVPCAGGQLAFCPELEATQLFSRQSGKPVGFVLGIALTPESELLESRHDVDSESIETVEHFVEALSGRYVALIDTHASRRFYVDPSCSLVAYYTRENGRVGASLPLVLDRPVKDNPSLPREAFKASTGNYYLLGETADADVKRMTANHFLDLDTFECRRHWPNASLDFAPSANPTYELDEIMGRLANHLKTLLNQRTCAFPISGGGDSRILLTAAALGNALDADTRYFVHTDNFMTKLDCIVAISIAQRLNLPLQVVSAKSARLLKGFSDERYHKLTEMVDLRSSYQDYFHTRKLVVHESPPKAQLLLRGGLIEMTRLNKWKISWGEFTPEKGLRALPHPRKLDDDFFKERLPKYREWYDALPDPAKEAAVDFGHFEIWLPAVANNTYQTMANHFMMNPFNDRFLLRNTAKLPHKFRRSGRPQRYIVRTYLPEIKDIPYAGKSLLSNLKNPPEGQDVFQSMGWA